MNSVFSAFKTNKSSDKHSASRSIGGSGSNSNSNNKKLINNGQNNSYENLRHIREIGTSTKMMTSVVVNDDVEDDLNLLQHNRTILKSANLNENDGYVQPLPKSSSAQKLLLISSQQNHHHHHHQHFNCGENNGKNDINDGYYDDDDDDEVDHVELDSNNLEMKLQEMKDEISMKRNLLNGGSNVSCSSNSSTSSSNYNSNNIGCNKNGSKISNNYSGNSSSNSYCNSKNSQICDMMVKLPSPINPTGKLFQNSVENIDTNSSLSITNIQQDQQQQTSLAEQQQNQQNQQQQQQQQIINSHLPPNSPAKSLSSTSISSNSSASCDVTTILSSLTAPTKIIEPEVVKLTINATEPTTNPSCFNNSNCFNDNSNNIFNYNATNSTVSNIFNGIVCSAKPPNSTVPIIMSNKNRNNQSMTTTATASTSSSSATQSSNSATTTPKSSRYNKPRLSLSSFNSNNSSMPSVHGRTSSGTNCNNNNGGQTKRLSNHQRNLSLDFRSMGILLPPISQVTNTRINLTQHHRNRSLDSALQRIPEVEVSSPNAETESTFCTNSILGSTMCSKIVSSSTEATAALSSVSSTTNSQNTPKTSSATQNNVKVSEPCTRQTSSENSYHTEHSTVANIVKSAENKKREDLTSLGSDDSGIICGSESDQVSLNRIRHSHESLDSGEMDPEEECIEILETTSMDEEYRMLQSDLCFYQTPEKDLRTLKCGRSRQEAQVATAENVDDESNEDEDVVDCANSKTLISMENNRIYVPINIEKENGNCAIQKSKSADCTEKGTTSQEDNSSKSNVDLSASTSSNSTKPEHIKNEILFKNFNFFGATKNAIFRTAQSIIENHEKKVAAKNQKADSTLTELDIKSPTEISKKKEFFVLKSSSNKNKINAATTTAIVTPSSQQSSQATTPEALTTTTQAPIPPPPSFLSNNTTTTLSIAPAIVQSSLSATTSPEIEINSMTKSNSISSLHKLRVPGVVKCFIREKDQTQQLRKNNSPIKTEKGPSGLLRFFESPVFNIHFAVHYLFYSKEPGVLSFIGNKIFNFPNQEVDLYIPQLIVMYIQMDELAEVLDPYLTIRCRRSVDFSLKCLWLLEAYNYQVDTVSLLSKDKKTNLSLMKELYSKKERKQIKSTIANVQQPTSPLARQTMHPEMDILSPIKKTHHRSQSDATGLLNDSRRYPSSTVGGVLSPSSLTAKIYSPPTPTTTKLCLGDLTSGRAFDNGCTCFESVRGTVNDLLGQKTVCCCGAPKTAPQKEFMKALINVGKSLTLQQTKAEKTCALRMSLNSINKNLPARVWLPLNSEEPHHIVRITEEKTAVLNSKDKTPYIIYVEVVAVNDIYSSPVILKMMPTLRHTKSEENLESKDNTCPHNHHHHHHHHHQHQHHHQQQQQPLSHNQHLKITKKDSNSSITCNNRNVINSNCGGSGDLLAVNKFSKHSESSNCSDHGNGKDLNDLQHFTEDDVWSQEDDEITAQYLNLHKISERDAVSQMSLDSCDSRDQGQPTLFNIGDVRIRHCNNLNCENTKPFRNDPEDPSAAALKEPWIEKERQIRDTSPYGHLSNWKLLSAIVKCGDDLRQELMATQLLQMFKIIWQEENVDLWVRPYKIVCLSDDSGLIEPILNTVSLHQIKKNSNKSLKDYFIDEYGDPENETFQKAQKNFVQSCAAYCLISYLLQVKDRHNGNILLHSDGHLIHIDFGFILSISPKNLGFEQSPFKLTPEFVEVMGGTSSELWTEFNHLLLKGLMAARKHMDRIINLVEIMRSNAQLPCFKNGCSGTVQNLRKRFHMNLTEQELERKVEQLVQDSLKSLSTKLYDGYQYFTNGIL